MTAEQRPPETPRAVEVEHRSVTLPGGLRVTLDLPRQDALDDLVVVIPPFGRRRDQVAMIGTYLAANRLPVLRVDLRNHDGESRGEITDFRLTGVVRDLEQVTAWAREEREPERMGLVTTSLSTRPALRFLATSDAADPYDLFAALVPVLDVRSVVAQAAKRDLFRAVRDEEYVGLVEVLTKYVDCPTFINDAIGADMEGPELAHEELGRLHADVALFAAGDDEWVSREDVLQAQEAGEGVHVFDVPHARHDIGRNLSAARVFLGQLTEVLLARHGIDDAVFEPSLEELIAQARSSRSRGRGAA